MSIGIRIKKLIEDKGITPYILSSETGIPESTISRIINNITKRPNQKNIKEIARYLRVSPSWLMTGGDENATVQNNEASVTMPREVFDQMIKMTDTIASQQRTIEALSKKTDVQPAANAKCVDAVG